MKYKIVFIVSDDKFFRKSKTSVLPKLIWSWIFLLKKYPKDVFDAACLDSVKVTIKLKKTFHILAPYRKIAMFVKRCSADQKPMAKFLKICSAYILRGYHCRTISIGSILKW